MKIGLALSGGGALGVAHIGILEAMERHGLRPARIGGTSAGSLMGLLYAAGGLDAINGFLVDMEHKGIINSGVGRLLLNTPDRIFTTLRETLETYVTVSTFAELSIPFSCAATDILTGKPIYLREGNPISAVLASCAYPGVFPVQQVHGRMLVDGGPTCNLPAEHIREEVDFLVGSSLYNLSELTPPQLRGRLNKLLIIARSLEIMEKDKADAQLYHCDFDFRPPMQSFKWFEFDHVSRIREVGRDYADHRIEQLLATLAGRSA